MGRASTDRAAVRTTQAKHIEGMACGLVQLETSQVMRASENETREASCGHVGWPFI